MNRIDVFVALCLYLLLEVVMRAPGSKIVRADTAPASSSLDLEEAQNEKGFGPASSEKTQSLTRCPATIKYPCLLSCAFRQAFC